MVRVIRSSRDRVEATNNLIQQFILTEKQAQAILDMRLQRLTSLEVEKIRAELEELHKQIAYFKQVLSSTEMVLDIIKTELTAVKDKYGAPRRTELSLDYGEIDIADLIEREDILVSMTHTGYIKRMPVSEYKAQRRGGMGITAHKTKDEDFVENIFVSNTHDEILFFTNFGKVYSVKGYEIPEAERQARGRAIINLLQLSEGEKVSAVIPRPEIAKGFLMMATRKGLIKKTPLAEFDSIRKVGKIAISLNEGDSLISVQMTCGYDEILVASNDGKCIRFSEEDVRPMGRDTQGVKSMNLNKDDYIVDMIVLKNGFEVMTMSEQGYGKRTEIEEFRLQSRAGKGIKAGVINEKTGKLVALKLVSADNDVMVIADNGIIIRIKAEEISKIGRDTQGVRIMKLKDSGKVVSVAVTPSEPEEPEEGAAESAETPESETKPATEE